MVFFSRVADSGVRDLGLSVQDSEGLGGEVMGLSCRSTCKENLQGPETLLKALPNPGLEDHLKAVLELNP